MRKIYLFIVSILMLLACNSQQDRQTASLVIQNGKVYTVNDANPNAEAIAVSNGKIVFVGSNDDVQQWIGEETEVLDVKGRTVTPGLIEGHGHFLGMGTSKLNLELLDVTSYEELTDRVAQAVKESQPGEWILGRGWHQSKWDSISGNIVKGFQTHDLLSSVSPDNPVFLRHASGHAGFANAKAMEIAGVQQLSVESLKTEDTHGGEVIRDELGNPTGIFNETAMSLISGHIPSSTREKDLRAMNLAVQESLKNGITSFQDAGASNYQIELARELLNEGKLKTRLWMMLSSRDTALLNSWYEKGPEIGSGDNFLTIRSIKIHADGALGSRGAWLLASYEDRANHFGHETTPMSFVYQVSKNALANGFQVCTHAIGDRTNREVLDMYEKAFTENPQAAKDHRFRIEHAQHLSLEDIPRFASLGVIPSMQAIHMSSDRPWAIHRLGKTRIEEGAYVWQKLLQSGARIVNGSDVPVEPINPIASFYASVTRKTLKGEPDQGYEPNQKMTREQALRSYTLDAAYGAFEEEIKGSIEVGKIADFTIYSQDLMKVPEEELLNTKIDFTIVNGTIEYKRE
ncbi:amidohydrolase [Fulvivirgaceae bacterium BMA10]|uniref:Amidohydrolase n=1 Tax=Splendidivirga corallicola TaxID=3051826 RepID=A0ABT8KTF8_9BACT|nr:amidohydrolase [Fulvivirgaceae bacterium BMA10]